MPAVPAGRLKRPHDVSLSAVIVLAVVPLLLWAGISTQRAIDDASAYERRVRDAQELRTALFTLQLDAETGLRGYTSTNDRAFLQPFSEATARYASTFAQARAAVVAARVDAAPLDDERALHDRWMTSVAQPLLAAPRAPSSTRVQFAGKALVDAMRRDDARLDAALDRAAVAGEARLTSAVWSVSFGTLIASVFIAALAGVIGMTRRRAMRRIAAERERYENEKRIADTLQQAFIQHGLPYLPGVGLHAMYVPAEDTTRVGGDWYDAFELPDGRLLFSIGDVAGHGIDAAVAMNRARQAIIVAALHEDDPAMVLARANRALMLQDAPMVTAICGYLDRESGEIVYATAGHPAPIMARAGESAYALPADGIVLGVDPDAAYRPFVAHAQDGATLVLYTDGVIEFDRDVIEGERKLLNAAAASAADPNPALAIHRAIFGEGRPRDDVAILTLSFRALADGGTHATISSAHVNQLDVRALADS